MSCKKMRFLLQRAQHLVQLTHLPTVHPQEDADQIHAGNHHKSETGLEDALHGTFNPEILNPKSLY